MDDDLDDVDQFPRHGSSEKEVVETYYLTQEFQFMPSPRLFDDPKICDKRDRAITEIIQHTRDRNDDVFIPYLAIHYYDRYVSWNKAPSSKRNSAYAMCCLFLALKIRVEDFKVLPFMKAERLLIRHKVVRELELKILKGLRWQLWSITPFSFLPYYYPRYEHLGGFKLSSVMNIFIGAQQDHNLARKRHSEIASSSLMAAAALAYPREFLNSFVNELDGTPWVCELIQLCGTKNIAIQRAEPRRPRNDEASTSRNNNANDSTKDDEPDEDALIRKRVSSSSSQKDRPISTRRPGKDEASSSHNNANDDSPEDDEPDEEQAISRRPGKEEAITSSEIIDDDPLAVTDDQAFSRRAGKEPMASEIDDESVAVTDEQEFSRRPGKEPMTFTSNIDEEDPLAVTDEQEFSRRPGKQVAADGVEELKEDLETILMELGLKSETIDPFIESTKEPDDDPKSRLKKLGFRSETIDPLFASTSEESGSLSAFTSQGGSAEQEIPKSPILGLVTRPLSVTHEPENPCGSSSGSSLVFPSQGNSSAVYHEQEIIPRRPEEHMASTSGVKEQEKTGKNASSNGQCVETPKEQEIIPRRPEEHMASTSGVKEIIPRRQGKEADATTSGVTAEEEIIPRRPGNEVLTTSQEIPRKTEKDEEERTKLIAALGAALEALEKTNESDEENVRVRTSQKFTREVELATSSLEAETDKSRKFINTLQSLFDASQRSMQSAALSDVSVHTPVVLPETSGFEASRSSVGGYESDDFWNNIAPERESSRNSSLQTQPPLPFEVEGPPLHFLPPPPPSPPHSSPDSTRNTGDCFNHRSVTDRLNPCCPVL